MTSSLKVPEEQKVPTPSFTYQDDLEQDELLNDVQVAIAQIAVGRGIPQEVARQEAFSRFHKMGPPAEARREDHDRPALQSLQCSQEESIGIDR